MRPFLLSYAHCLIRWSAPLADLALSAAKHEEILNSVTTKYQEEVANLRLTIEKQSVSAQC